MASSNISSAARKRSGPASPPRKRFALIGPSVRLDPETHAVRRDLADVDLADRVFAPHYAKALMATCVVDATPILAAGLADAEVRATLARGEAFRVLEITDDFAWGQAADSGVAGFVDRHALAADPE